MQKAKAEWNTLKQEEEERKCNLITEVIMQQHCAVGEDMVRVERDTHAMTTTVGNAGCGAGDG